MMNIDDLGDSVGRLEGDCGLPEGFCVKLVQEDDWSFVIKMHSLLESAVSRLLTTALGRSELEDIFSALDTSNTKTGKIAFTSALGLLPKQHLDFIRSLSELRNRLVHRVKNVACDLHKHFQEEREKRSSRDAQRLADKWAFAIQDGDKPTEPLARYHFTFKHPETGEQLSRQVTFFGKPKVAILTSAMAILDAISMSNRYGEHIWTFLMESDDREAFLARAEETFAKAKVGERDYPLTVKERLERRNPGLRIRLDDDGQPILESLAAAFYLEYHRILAEL